VAKHERVLRLVATGFSMNDTNVWNQLKVSLFGLIDWRQIAHMKALCP